MPGKPGTSLDAQNMMFSWILPAGCLQFGERKNTRTPVTGRQRGRWRPRGGGGGGCAGGNRVIWGVFTPALGMRFHLALTGRSTDSGTWELAQHHPSSRPLMRSAWKGWGGGWSRGQGYSTCQSPDFPGRPEVPTSTPVEEASSCNWAATDGSEGR